MTKKRILKIDFDNNQLIHPITYSLKMLVRRAVEATLDHENFKWDAEISVTFCSAEYIRELNRTYRSKDSETDVLSFPMYERDELTESECALGVMLGDVVISVPRVRTQAAELGNTFNGEAAFLAVHSTLHLLGYDHERSAEDDEIQCEKQRRIKEEIGEIL
jgi:probable rRNA maturation factor